MEEKLQREKEKEKEEAEAEAVEKKDVTELTEVKETHNEVEEVPSGMMNHQPTPFESLTAVDAPSPAAVDSITYTPGPIRVPTVDPVESNSIASVSELPPVPQTIVEHERLEMIEINNDGTSGHLTHSLE